MKAHDLKHLASLETLAAHISDEIAARRNSPEQLFSATARLQLEAEVFELREEQKQVQALIETTQGTQNQNQPSNVLPASTNSSPIAA